MDNIKLVTELMAELGNTGIFKDNENIKLEKIYSDIGELQQKAKKEDSHKYDDLIVSIADLKRGMIEKYIQVGMALERAEEEKALGEHRHDL